MSRPKIDPDQRRELVFGRVFPETLSFLKGLGEKNIGRAIDKMFTMLKEFIKDESTAPTPRKSK